MEDAIKLMELAFSSYSDKQCYVPPRYVNAIPGTDLTMILKPVYMKNIGRMAIKILSQYEQTGNTSFPAITGIVLLLDGDSGQILGLMDGSYVTALRTGAASGIATDYLARKDAEIMAVFGCGVQGRTQLEAVAGVRDIKQVYIYDINPDRAEIFKQEMSGRLDLVITHTDDLDQLKKADIICTSTNSRSPLFSMDHIKDGVHINAIGSYKPFMQEIDPGIIKRSRLYVDSIDSCIRESGDIIIPLKAGIISGDHVIGEIGSVILGRADPRISDEDITVFKSVGIAIQDLVVANEAYRKITGNSV
jgi:ornithine cyclodeaminase/alanine dehydrogenase